MESIDPQFAVAKWLHKKGVDITINGLDVSPEASQAKLHTDGGDIVTPKGVIDVKHLKNVEFTNAIDFPYPQATAGFKPSIDKLMPGLYAAFFVNAAIGHAYIVKSDTSHAWSVRDVYDAVTGNPKPSYFVGLEHCRFIEL
tara:strand:+ start:112 stop:534 length:423 start_codon:yes stop_codon:yes gene_type:complete